jgi:hypothetical protein
MPQAVMLLKTAGSMLQITIQARLLITTQSLFRGTTIDYPERRIDQ